MDHLLQKKIDYLLLRYPILKKIEKEIIDAYKLLEETFLKNGKLLIAGNGGSAADSQHIVGELMKSFRIPRPISKDFSAKLTAIDSARGSLLAKQLERGLCAISLTTHAALQTAFLNDVGGCGFFAQQLLGYGRSGDLFLGISTSGNSENIIQAAIVARALGIKVIALTGKKGGELIKFADVFVRVPYDETYLIQELHLPIYHCWCSMLEEKFFGNKN